MLIDPQSRYRDLGIERFACRQGLIEELDAFLHEPLIQQTGVELVDLRSPLRSWRNPSARCTPMAARTHSSAMNRQPVVASTATIIPFVARRARNA
jgi:hypothetical protein